jgi:hypothetical protein
MHHHPVGAVCSGALVRAVAQDGLHTLLSAALISGCPKQYSSTTAHAGKQKSSGKWLAGIKESYGKLACFTDDDAIWNSYFLKYLLAPFNDDKMGGTGSNQIMRPCRMDVPPTTFERIGDMRLSSRMLEAAASTFYDGSVSCLSGRTALYHKRILAPLENFEKEFCNEYWLKCALVFLCLALPVLPVTSTVACLGVPLCCLWALSRNK